MRFTQIRNATITIEYNSIRFLVDPVLAAKGTWPSFANAPRQEEGNPSVELPLPIKDILDVDAVIVTHLHEDHLDRVAKKLLPKNIKLFVQNNADYQVLNNDGFSNLEILSENTTYHGVSLTPTKGQHGRGDIVQRMGNVCGVVLQHPSEKTVYIAGDTVWYEETDKVMQHYHPEVVVVNAGANRFFNSEPLVMDQHDVYSLHQAAPYANIIASHMEAMNHWSLSRAELREYAIEKKFSNSLLIPKDGESYEL